MKLRDYIFYAFVIVCLIAGFSGAYNWYNPNEVIVEKWRDAKAPKVITKIKRVEVVVEKVVVIEKKSAEKEIDLPDEVMADEKKQILAVAEIPPYEGKTTAIAILDTGTKETKINIRHERLPLIGFESIKELWLKAGYGIDTKGIGYNIEVGGEWKVVRIGKIHLGLFGQADMRQNVFAGVKVSYRW